MFLSHYILYYIQRLEILCLIGQIPENKMLSFHYRVSYYTTGTALHRFTVFYYYVYIYYV